MDDFTSMPSLQQISLSFFNKHNNSTTNTHDDNTLTTPLTPGVPVDDEDSSYAKDDHGRRGYDGYNGGKGARVDDVRRSLKAHPLHAVPTPLAMLHKKGIEDESGGGGKVGSMKWEDEDMDEMLGVSGGGGGGGNNGSDMEVEGCKLNRWERFVLQWDVTHYGMALGFSAYTIMIRGLAAKFPEYGFFEGLWLWLWYVSLGIAIGVTCIYGVRCVMFLKVCLADFNDHRLVNFFFAPLVVAASLAISTPDKFLKGEGGIDSVGLHVAFWVLLIGQMAGALWLYGDWLFGGKIIVGEIHPLFFMAVIGWFLVANIGGRVGEADAAQFAFAVGSLFWLIVFVTTFQHLSHSFREKLQKPQPTMFLFIAPPAAAAVAWIQIEAALGASVPNLDFMSSFFLYIDMFLYLLILRLFPLFWTHPFGVVWWAYIFPLSSAASTIVWFSTVRKTTFWTILAVSSSIVATLAYLIVASFTLWALFKGKVPHNPKAVQKYCESMKRQKRAIDELSDEVV